MSGRLGSSWMVLLLVIAGCEGPVRTVPDAGRGDGGRVERDGAADPGGGPLPDGGPPPDGAPPDSGPEPCDAPGTVETVPCGRCGTVERFCTVEGTWSYGECTGEGECVAGTVETVPCGNCGSQMRRCTAACTWENVGGCTGEGECAPGTTTQSSEGCPAGHRRELTCDAACTFVPTSECTADACPTPGARETVPCGMCGTQERFCNASRVWEYGTCFGEGECLPGTTGAMPCGMCGTQPARCDTSCSWVPVAGSSCTGEGVCAPGQRTRTSAGCPAGETRLVECDAACGYTIEIEPCRATVPIDVLFLIDATASNWDQFAAERSTFIGRCVDPLLATMDVYVGLAYYADLDPPNPFVAAIELGPATSAAIDADISSRTSLLGGWDSTMEALHILSGGTPHADAVPFRCSPGRVAGGCWRPGAERIIVMHTDEDARSGPDPSGPGLVNPWPSGPTWTTVLPQLMSDGTRLLVILDHDYSPSTALGEYREMVSDLGQPTTDVHVVGTSGIGPVCDSIVARVRAIAMP